MGELNAEVLEAGAAQALIAVSGELDIATAEQLEAVVAPVLESRPARLVLDLSGLRFADSSAIAQWVRWAAQVEELELRNPPPIIRRVLASMGLTSMLGVTP